MPWDEWVMDAEDTFHLRFNVLKNDVIFEISLPTGANHTSADGIEYSAIYNILDDSKSISATVGISNTARAKLRRLQGNIISARGLYRVIDSDQTYYSITTDNIEQLLHGNHAINMMIRLELLEYLDKKLEEAPGTKTSLIELIAVLNRDPKRIMSALINLEQQQLVEPKLLSTFDNLNEMEEYVDIYRPLMSPIEPAPNSNLLREAKISKYRKELVEIRPATSTEAYKHYKLIPIDADRYEGNFIFVMTEFRGALLERFEKLLVPLCDTDFGLPAIISRDDHLPFQIDDKIISHIHSCKFGIADISSRNLNVMYELGFAHAINKDVIIICDESKKKADDIFDIRNINTIYFKTENDLKDQLKKMINAVINLGLTNN